MREIKREITRCNVKHHTLFALIASYFAILRASTLFRAVSFSRFHFLVLHHPGIPFPAFRSARNFAHIESFVMAWAAGTKVTGSSPHMWNISANV